jgi:lantibiotic modifying enzyme
VEGAGPGLGADPEGLYDLGLAHGNAGILALLGQACARGVAAAEARALLAGAVPWLLAHQNPSGSPSRFPTRIVPGQENGSSRVAWCYGDLGIAVALLVAARGAREPDWERTALGLARGAAARSLEDSGVADAGLCHGAGGNAHLFNRLFQATGDPVLGQAARTWAGRALEMRRPGEGIGGYLTLVPNQRLEKEWAEDPGFLTGAAGIGLALLALATPIEPSWDRALLVSVP